METTNLFMVMLGCKPDGRLTEQHDIFFGIANSLKELIPQFDDFWPEAKGKIHIDAWRKVTSVDGYSVAILPKKENPGNQHLYFLNLGGYRPGEFEEYHYKILSVAETISEAIKKSKQYAFYKHFGFKGAESHIDDKYGIDVDDTYKVDDILSPDLKSRYSLEITPSQLPEDELHIGYVPLSKL